MLTEPEKIAHKLVSFGRDRATETLRAYAGLLRDAGLTMEKFGWVRVDIEHGALMHEGRPVQWVGRKAFVLPPDIFEQRRLEAIEAVKARAEMERPKVQAKPGEALTSVICPSCHSTMAKQPVCPNCSKGKAGYKIICICTECAHEVYL